MKLNTYLTFDGNCEEAFNFYKSVFGGEFTFVDRYGNMPAEAGAEIPESLKNKIMHISLPIGGDTLMGSDEGGGWGKGLTIGNNFSISINNKSKSEADELYKKLSENGVQKMPMEEMFWGDYFGMLTDQFGINWLINTSSK
jgi:PhnB protein